MTHRFALVALLLFSACSSEQSIDLRTIERAAVVASSIEFEGLSAIDVGHGSVSSAFVGTPLSFAVALDREIRFYTSLGKWSRTLGMGDLDAANADNLEILGCAFHNPSSVFVLLHGDTSFRISRYNILTNAVDTWALPHVPRLNGSEVLPFVLQGMVDMLVKDDSTLLLPIQLHDGSFEPGNEVWERKFRLPPMGVFRLRAHETELLLTGGIGTFSKQFLENRYFNIQYGINAIDEKRDRLVLAYGFENDLYVVDLKSSRAYTTRPIISREILDVEPIPFEQTKSVSTSIAYFARNYIFKHVRLCDNPRRIVMTLIHPDVDLLAATPNERNWAICVWKEGEDVVRRYSIVGDTYSNDHFIQESDSVFYIASKSRTGAAFTIHKLVL